MQFVHMKVNVDQLRTFITVVESGGIERAVARLHLSQPAASRQMRALEARACECYQAIKQNNLLLEIGVNAHSR